MASREEVEKVYDKLGMIKSSEFDQLFKSQIMGRGAHLFRDGAVKKYTVKDDIYEATVKGTKNYKVKIKMIDNKVIDLSCSCPYEDNCKHEYALIKKIVEDYNYPIIKENILELKNHMLEKIEKYDVDKHNFKKDFPMHNYEQFLADYRQFVEEVDKALEEYMMYGGLPFITNLKTEEEKINYLKSLFEKVYFADIIEKNNIRKDDLLDEIINCLASTIGSLTNVNNIVNTFKSRGLANTEYNTISNYIEYLENSFMINKATRYDIRGRQYIQTPYKYYFEDLGLRNARLNFRQYDREHLMENIIYNELISRGYNVDVGVVEKYVNNKNNKTTRKLFEVDFVCNLGSKRFYIQSAYSLDSNEKIIQEKNSLTNINDSFKKIIIVNDNTISYYDNNGIKIMNLKEFLTDIDSLEK